MAYLRVENILFSKRKRSANKRKGVVRKSYALSSGRSVESENRR